LNECDDTAELSRLTGIVNRLLSGLRARTGSALRTSAPVSKRSAPPRFGDAADAA
jgi:hypothetical protein